MSLGLTSSTGSSPSSSSIFPSKIFLVVDGLSSSCTPLLSLLLRVFLLAEANRGVTGGDITFLGFFVLLIFGTGGVEPTEVESPLGTCLIKGVVGGLPSTAFLGGFLTLERGGTGGVSGSAGLASDDTSEGGALADDVDRARANSLMTFLLLKLKERLQLMSGGVAGVPLLAVLGVQRSCAVADSTGVSMLL